MTTWEFLLQREGDRTWLPLETATVEILEGRYRLVARSACHDTAVQVQIRYWNPEEVPPKRRVHRRDLQTNPKGLLAIFPFTHLRAGHWEIQCHPSQVADSSGASPQTLELEVLPQEGDLAFEPEIHLLETGAATPFDSGPETSHASQPINGAAITAPSEPELTPTPQNLGSDLPSDAPSEPPTPEQDPSDLPEIRQLAEQMSQLVVNSVLEFTDNLADTAAASQPEEQELTAAAQQPQPGSSRSFSGWHLTLDHTSLTFESDRAVIAGRLQPGDKADPLTAFQGIVRVTLREPTDLETATCQSMELSLAEPVTEFSLELERPSESDSQLYIGEVQILAMDPETDASAEDASVLVATQTFQVLPPAAELLNQVAVLESAQIEWQPNMGPGESEVASTAVDTESKATSSDPEAIAPLSEAGMASESMEIMPKEVPLQAGGQQVLPPRLTQKVSQQKHKLADIHLPTFRKTTEAETLQPRSESTPELTSTTPSEIDALPAATLEPEPVALPAAIDSLPLSEPISELEEDLNLDLDLEANPDPNRITLRSPGPTQENDPITESESSNSEFSEATAPIAPNFVQTIEVVVEDERLAPKQQRNWMLVRPQALLILPKDRPIPDPILHVPDEELTAGRDIFITIQLPKTEATLAVKFWLVDYQTRQIMSDPYWVTNFLSTNAADPDKVEALFKVSVPHGCLELQMAAITYEVETRRESHKVAVLRSVVPPNLPEPTPLSDLEL